jgi:hypothetical protein
MPFIKKHQLSLFFITWFLLNLLQAGSTGLFDDEAYYWIYSKFPAWGYFDHPPMIALFIKAGYLFFHNEFGVRLLIVICSTATLGIIYLLLPKRNDPVFYTIVCSMAILQIGGIIAVPDLPLTFFVALFFLCYKRFCSSMTWLNTLALGIVMAFMLYTKYHAILIIFFTFLSNPRMALRYRAYVAALIGAALFVPHLYWQYSHEFPSVYYHLFERNASSYQVSFTIEYVIGQVLIAGPFMGWLVLWAAFRYRPLDTFEKALQYSLWGIYILFFVSTLKGRVEANWTVPAFIPLIILSHQYLMKNEKWQCVLIRSIPLTLVFVLAVRIYMMLDIGPMKFVSKDEFHNNRGWADSIYKKTKGLPVVFIDSYQYASKYWFYTGVPAFSLNTPSGRRNNFNFWPVEDSLLGKKIAALSPYDYSYYKDSVSTPLGTTGMLIVDSFYAFSKLNIISPAQLQVLDNTVKDCQLHFSVEQAYLSAFQSPQLKSLEVKLVIVHDDHIVGEFPVNIRLSDIRQKEQSITTTFKVHMPKGKYVARYSLPSVLSIDPSLNSTSVKVLVR